MFLVGLYQLLWSLLLIVPGIIKTFSYAMTPYILKEYPELAPVDAIHRSRVMMDGHKMKLFLLPPPPPPDPPLPPPEII